MFVLATFAACVFFILLVQTILRHGGDRRIRSTPTIYGRWSASVIRNPSPDGKRIVFTKRVFDIENNKSVTDLWLVNVDGSGLRRLTTHPAGAAGPHWSPSGASIFFLSGRSESSQVWKIPVDGGEAEQVTDLPLEVDGYLLSPDGANLLLAMGRPFPIAKTLQGHQGSTQGDRAAEG